MQFHIGKVMKVIKQGKDVVAADSSVHAIVEMWDHNQLTLAVEEDIAGQLKLSDIVLVDYNPINGISPPVPRQTVVKILKGKQGKECWEMFKKYYAERKKREKQKEEDEPQAGISYSR